MVSWFISLFLAGVFFAVLLTIIPLHNIENESYFEYYALLWSHTVYTIDSSISIGGILYRKRLSTPP
jgi:hypothetical protein